LLTEALGEQASTKLVSSDALVYEYLAIKLPAEVEIMRSAAALTAKWQLEAYAQVVPGKTTDRDVALFLKQRMAEAGVEDAWAPEQNPNVVSGTDRGYSHATDRIIQAGAEYLSPPQQDLVLIQSKYSHC
jgi:Xaa-Pro dipeptidase